MSNRFYKTILLVILCACNSVVAAHHWFQESHEMDTLLTVEVEVVENRFINPHPFFSGRIVDAKQEPIETYGDLNEQWQLQMDNRWELQDLGFDDDTLIPGDIIIISAHPGSFRKNILYVKALDHPRLGFRYEHNVRELIELP